MSLHAQLSPEAQARLDAMKRNSTISSIIIAVLSIVLIGLLLGFIFIQPFLKETPVIVTYSATVPAEEVLETKKSQHQLQTKTFCSFFLEREGDCCCHDLERSDPRAGSGRAHAVHGFRQRR